MKSTPNCLLLLSVILSAFFPILALGQADETDLLSPNWGLSKFGDSLFVDQSEIRVGEWLDYLYYHDPSKFPNYLQQKKLAPVELKRLMRGRIETDLLPDSTILNAFPWAYLFKKCRSAELLKFASVASFAYLPVERDSLNNPASKERLLHYLKYPITGVTYKQAIAFCKWRTYVDSLRYYYNPVEVYSRDGLIMSYNYSCIYSLPTPAQFDTLNPDKDSLYLYLAKFVAGFNYKDAPNCDEHDKLIGQSLVECYRFPFSTKKVMYSTVDVQGNAAEMTNVFGQAKGGSYFHYARESKKGTTNPYLKAEPWLGFRCIARPRKATKMNASLISIRDWAKGEGLVFDSLTAGNIRILYHISELRSPESRKRSIDSLLSLKTITTKDQIAALYIMKAETNLDRNSILECYQKAIDTSRFMEPYYREKRLDFLYGTGERSSILSKADKKYLKEHGYKPKLEGSVLGLEYFQGSQSYIGVQASIAGLMYPRYRLKNLDPVDSLSKELELESWNVPLAFSILNFGFDWNLNQPTLQEFTFSLFNFTSPCRVSISKFGFTQDPSYPRKSWFYRPEIGTGWGIFSVAYCRNFVFSRSDRNRAEKNLFSIKISYPISRKKNNSAIIITR